MNRKFLYLRRNSIEYNVKYFGHLLYKKIYRLKVEDFNVNEKICFDKLFNEDVFTGEILDTSIEFNENIIKEANKVLEHRINILGYNDIYLGKDIDWHKDYINEYRWENKYYREIRKTKDDKIKDIKIPWEISRLQHLMVLVQAYIISKDKKYSQECINQIISWIESNPILYGVNWACTMEVSIRAVNMLILTTYLKKYNLISNTYLKKISDSLYQHLLFITKNIEYGVIRGNHYLSNYTALLILGIGFSETKLGKSAVKYSIKNIEKEMKFQVNSDGTNHESATNYHVLVTELFLFSYIFCSKFGVELSEEYRIKLIKMINFIVDIIKPNNKIPSIGDSDDGVFIKYSPKTNRILDILSISAVVFENLEMWNRSNQNYDLLKHIFNEKYINSKINNIDINYKKVFNNNLIKYNNGGYYIINDDEVYVIFRAGNIGLKGRGGHGHCDQLSFEINILSNDIFIDSGTYIYTGDLEQRNRFRSTTSHNTLMINNLEQDYIDKNKPFEMQNESKTKVLKLESNSQYHEIVAEHYGYKFKTGDIHRRSLIYDKIENEIKITDYIIGDNVSQLKWTFNLAPGLKRVEKFKNKIEIEFEDIIVLFYYDSNSMLINIEDTYISEVYGKKIKTKKVQFNSESIQKKFEFVIKYEVKDR